MSRIVAVCLFVLATLLAAASAADAKPRNGRIVFSDPGRLFSIRPDGSGRRLVTGQWYANRFAAAPDGRELITGGSEALDIFSARDGARVDQLRLPRKSWIGNPEWSLSGREVAFEMCDETVFTDIEECVTYGVYRLRPGGDGPHRVAEGMTPSWSRDGRSLVFMHKVRAHDAGGNECYGIYSARKDGSHLQRVLPHAKRCLDGYSRPFFSADGKRILYQHGRGLWSVRRSGRGRRLEVQARRGWVMTYSQLSPDGRRIATLTTDFDGPAGSIDVTGADGSSGTSRQVVRTRYTSSFAWLPVASR